MYQKNIEIPINRLIIGFGLIFILGVLFAILNGYYIQESQDPLPFIVYVISVVSIGIGATLVFLFQSKINKLQLTTILNILDKAEAEVIKVLLEHNNRLEQNHLVAYTGYNKVKISRILTNFEQKGIIEKRQLGNTNLVILKLKKDK